MTCSPAQAGVSNCPALAGESSFPALAGIPISGPGRMRNPGAPMRTHFCGLIDEALIGQTVTLCGWADVARNLGGLCFIDLRDHEGIVQIVAEPTQDPALGAGEINAAVIAAAAQVGYEDCLRITGVVRKREAVNAKIRTGQVEVVATRIELLNKA